MNYSDPVVTRTIDEWLEFDSKDLKSPKRRLKVKSTWFRILVLVC